MHSSPLAALHAAASAATPLWPKLPPRPLQSPFSRPTACAVHAHAVSSLDPGVLRCSASDALACCFCPPLALLLMSCCYVHTSRLPLSRMLLERGGAGLCCMQATGSECIEHAQASWPKRGCHGAWHPAFKGYVCSSCFGSNFQIVHVWQDTGEFEEETHNGKKRYVCFLYRMLIDEKGVIHNKQPMWQEVADWRNPKFYFPFRTSSGRYD